MSPLRLGFKGILCFSLKWFLLNSNDNRKTAAGSVKQQNLTHFLGIQLISGVWVRGLRSEATDPHTGLHFGSQALKKIVMI